MRPPGTANAAWRTAPRTSYRVGVLSTSTVKVTFWLTVPARLSSNPSTGGPMCFSFSHKYSSPVASWLGSKGDICAAEAHPVKPLLTEVVPAGRGRNAEQLERCGRSEKSVSP